VADLGGQFRAGSRFQVSAFQFFSVSAFASPPSAILPPRFALLRLLRLFAAKLLDCRQKSQKAQKEPVQHLAFRFPAFPLSRFPAFPLSRFPAFGLPPSVLIRVHPWLKTVQKNFKKLLTPLAPSAKLVLHTVNNNTENTTNENKITVDCGGYTGCRNHLLAGRGLLTEYCGLHESSGSDQRVQSNCKSIGHWGWN
jgi:hypothetical protein